MTGINAVSFLPVF